MVRGDAAILPPSRDLVGDEREKGRNAAGTVDNPDRGFGGGAKDQAAHTAWNGTRGAQVTIKRNGEGSGMQVVIAGGGVIGAATAYYLAERGVAATVVEPVAIACGASGKSGGFLA